MNALVKRIEKLERESVQRSAPSLPTPEELRIAATGGSPEGDITWTPELLASELRTSSETIRRIERGAFKHQRQCTWMMVDLIASKLKIPKETYRMAIVRARNAWLEQNAQSRFRTRFHAVPQRALEA